MHTEIRNCRLYFYPDTIQEFQDIHIWVEVNMPCNAFIYRPIAQLQELRQQLLSDSDTIEQTFQIER